MFNNLTDRLSHIVRTISGRARFTEENTKQTLREVRKALLEADVSLEVIRDFIGRMQNTILGGLINKSLTPEQAFIQIVQKELTFIMGESVHLLNVEKQKPAVILLAGTQGAGKTTTAAKLAKFLQKNKKLKILMVSTDIYRPAAIKQLQLLAQQVNVDFLPSNEKELPIDIARRAHKHASLNFFDILLVDTAGRSHVDDKMMSEIQQIHSTLQPIETLFIVDAMVGQDAVNMAKIFNKQLPITGIILSKADGDSRGGAALSVRYITGKPIKFIGTGEKCDALEPFYPDRMASRILGMGDVLSLIEDLEHKADYKKNEKLINKISQGNIFNFEDFKGQLSQMQKLGGMSNIINKLPGGHSLPEQLTSQLDNKILIRMEAMINSMTAVERQLKVPIKGSRKRRIAAGAGVQIQDVNRMLKQFEQMQQMMKKIKNNGLSKIMRQIKTMFPSIR